MTKRVLLIRHGQTDWNTEGRWQGVMDVPLNATGIAQARALATHLSQQEIGAIYSSDLQRAALTAQTVSVALKLQPKFDPRLRELNIGILQGMTYLEMAERYPSTVQHMHADYMDFVFPQGESRRMMQSRAYEFWQDTIDVDKTETVAIITHGGVIRTLLLRLFDEGGNVPTQGFGNTSVTTIDREESGGWRLAQIGSIVHLTEDSHTVNEA